MTLCHLTPDRLCAACQSGLLPYMSPQVTQTQLTHASLSVICNIQVWPSCRRNSGAGRVTAASSAQLRLRRTEDWISAKIILLTNFRCRQTPLGLVPERFRLCLSKVVKCHDELRWTSDVCPCHDSRGLRKSYLGWAESFVNSSVPSWHAY